MAQRWIQAINRRSVARMVLFAKPYRLRHYQIANCGRTRAVVRFSRSARVSMPKSAALHNRRIDDDALELKLAHSPDSDDAFMFYALATNKIRSEGLKFTHVLADIETLNRAAEQETYDVT